MTVSLGQLQQMSAIFGPHIETAIMKAASRHKTPVCVHQIIAKQPNLSCHYPDRNFIYCYEPCYDTNCQLPRTLPDFMSSIGLLPVRYRPSKA